MKNQYELKFEKTIIEMILSNNHQDLSKTDLIMDFHRNSSIYYDNLCDALYELSNGQSIHPLWISASGNPYLSSISRNKEDLKVLTFDQIPEFIDDLYDQLKATLAILHKTLQKNTKCS